MDFLLASLRTAPYREPQEQWWVNGTLRASVLHSERVEASGRPTDGPIPSLLHRNDGKENGNYYSGSRVILRLRRGNGKENGNYYFPACYPIIFTQALCVCS